MRKIQVLILLAAVMGTAWMTTWVDDGMVPGWTHGVVRNWEQFGFFNLHGKMVSNPGGFQVETHPVYYAGHRPASLYPVFICHRLLGATGLGFLAYYAIMAAVVMLSIWQLLGRTERAFWLAITVVLAPGYVRWQTTLDPNLTAVLLGFPFCVGMLGLLRRPTLGWFHWGALFLLILVYSSVNWTTIFVHAMLFVTLLVLPRVSWRHLLIYAGLTAAAAGGVLLASLSSKMAMANGSSAGLASVVQGYGWGNAGYGLDMSTKTACLRLLAANGIGLLPVLVYLGWQWWRRGGRQSAGPLIFLLPALVPVVEVLGMRNYFGCHPWMSVHFILLGIILSATVWKERAGAAVDGETRPRLAFCLGFLAVTFAYGLTVLAAGHAHNERELKLAALIREHTARDTTIVIRRDTDPDLAGLESRLPELFDRHLVVVSDTGEASLADVPAKRVILTAVAPPSEKTIAQTGGTDDGDRVFKKLLGWYARHIAHRRAGDKLELGEKYFLYQPPGWASP